MVELPTNHGAVVAISVDPQGQTLAAVYEARRAQAVLLLEAPGRVVPDRGRRSRSTEPSGAWLTPILPMGVERLVGVGDGSGLMVFDVASGLPRQRLRIADDNGARPAAGHAARRSVRASTRSASRVTVLTHDDSHWVVLDPSDDRLYPTGCKWLPGETGAHALRFVPISWRYAPPVLELVGVDRNGAVRAAEFYVDGGSVQLIASRVATTEAGYIGAAHAGSNTVVAVSPLGIDWLSFHGDRFRLSQKWQKADLSFSSAVACFATHSRDAVVVCSRGLVMRVPLPPRGSGAKKR